MAIPLAAYLVGGGLLASGLGKDLLGIFQQGSLGRKELGLREMMAEYEVEGDKRANEENRKMTEKYLSMLRSTENRRSRESSQARQMQLIMAMMQGLGQFQQGANRTFANANRPMPPMALTTLMRGM